jgi:hypothetical protein
LVAILLLVALTCWVNRNDWFPKLKYRRAKTKTPPAASAASTPPATSTTPTAPTTKKGVVLKGVYVFWRVAEVAGGWIGLMVLLLVLYNLGTYTYRGYRWRQEMKKPVVTHVPPVRPSMNMQPSIPILPTPPYSFGANGCISKKLGSQARWRPIGGCMIVHRPNETSYEDCPGVKSPLSNLGPGTWKFCQKNAKTTGVLIW